MTLNELKSEYARLGDEFDALACSGGASEPLLARRLDELDALHRELSELRRRTLRAPTLRDAVSRPVAVALRPLAASSALRARPLAVPVELAQTLPRAG